MAGARCLDASAGFAAWSEGRREELLILEELQPCDRLAEKPGNGRGIMES